MDQNEWITKLRGVTDGYFIYMTYTVPKSSELYSPYALRYKHLKDQKFGQKENSMRKKDKCHSIFTSLVYVFRTGFGY